MRFRNYRNRHNKKNRIYSSEELLAMTLNDLLDDEPAILAQDKEIGIPDYEELRQSPNTRWIDKYTDEYGQQHGGYYGSISDYEESFAPKIKYPVIEENPYPSYPIYMSDEEPVEEEQEEEKPIVLEGGVEENVYLPDDILIPPEEEKTLPEEEQRLPSDDFDSESIPNENKFDLDDDVLLDILQEIFKGFPSSKVRTPEIWNDSQNDTFIPTQKHSVTLPNSWQYGQTSDLEKFYKELLEELRKRMRLGRFTTTASNAFEKIRELPIQAQDIINELLNYSERTNQKKEIDDYLNQYVNKNNVPDEYKNALRHRAGSLIMAKKNNNEKAKFWGDLKEMLDLASGHDSKVGSAIDAQNNYIGRSLYEKYKDKNLSNDELIDKIIEGIKKYNPDEGNYKDWQKKDSKTPLQNILNGVNSITRPINKIYKRSIQSTKKNPVK